MEHVKTPEKFPSVALVTSARTVALARPFLRAKLFPFMSAAQIINELPKLTEAERRAVREKLLELAQENQDIAACNQAALDGALMLDRMEDKDAGTDAR